MQKSMEEKRIEQLYTILERVESAKREQDKEAIAALRWAIFELERR